MDWDSVNVPHVSTKGANAAAPTLPQCKSTVSGALRTAEPSLGPVRGRLQGGTQVPRGAYLQWSRLAGTAGGGPPFRTEERRMEQEQGFQIEWGRNPIHNKVTATTPMRHHYFLTTNTLTSAPSSLLQSMRMKLSALTSNSFS